MPEATKAVSVLSKLSADVLADLIAAFSGALDLSDGAKPMQNGRVTLPEGALFRIEAGSLAVLNSNDQTLQPGEFFGRLPLASVIILNAAAINVSDFVT